METKKLTAVEWLRRDMESNFLQLLEGFLTIQEYMDEFDNTIKQAKQIEKEQIIDAFIIGEHQQGYENEAEEYYDETYNN